MSEKLHITGLSKTELAELVKSIGEPKYRGGQIFRAVHEQRLQSFDEITNLPKQLREKLNEMWTATSLKIENRYVSEDGTRRFLMKTHDNFPCRDGFYSNRKPRHDLFFVAIRLSAEMRFLSDGETRTA